MAKYCDYSDASENVGQEIVAIFFYALGLENEIKNAFSPNQLQSNNTATINEYASLIEVRIGKSEKKGEAYLWR